MIISARNQLKGRIEEIRTGAVNTAVTLKTSGGDWITAMISKMSAEELGLVPGKDAIAVIKATDVMIGIGELKISARNQLAGEIAKVEEGAVNAIVTLRLSSGDMITSTISMAAVNDLGLAQGVKAKAIIKATSVMIAV